MKNIFDQHNSCKKIETPDKSKNLNEALVEDLKNITIDLQAKLAAEETEREKFKREVVERKISYFNTLWNQEFLDLRQNRGRV